MSAATHFLKFIFNSVRSNPLKLHWTFQFTLSTPRGMCMSHNSQLTCDFARKNSENRLNRFDGCKTTGVHIDRPIQLQTHNGKESERNTHSFTTCVSFWLYSLLEVHLCLFSRRRLCFMCIAVRATYESHSIREIIIIIFYYTLVHATTAKCLVNVCVCVSLLFCQRMPGRFSFLTPSVSAQVRLNRAPNHVYVCVYASGGEIGSPGATEYIQKVQRSYSNLVSLLLD